MPCKYNWLNYIRKMSEFNENLYLGSRHVCLAHI